MIREAKISTLFRSRKAVGRDIDRLLNTLREKADNGLHLGSGGHRIPNLINCDKYDVRADVQVDSLDLSIFKDGSVDLIETHHMIEHLSFAELDTALVEWRRCLAEDGFLVITCPNFTKRLSRNLRSAASLILAGLVWNLIVTELAQKQA